MSQMADNVVVIGKGKLIADTSISKLLASSKGGGVFVRVGSRSKLESALKKESAQFEAGEGGLIVKGLSTDEVGKLAFAAGLPVLELSQHAVSLEEAFLEITAGSEEYQAGKRAKS